MCKLDEAKVRGVRVSFVRNLLEGRSKNPNLGALVKKSGFDTNPIYAKYTSIYAK